MGTMKKKEGKGEKITMGHYYEGGDSRKRLDYIFENCISYTHNPLENMNMSLKSRDKRKSRRHREEMEERRGSHDITTFVSRTHKQQDFILGWITLPLDILRSSFTFAQMLVQSSREGEERLRETMVKSLCHC